jgi:glycosyltransferase involved in cell wall biosynthesis
LSASRPKTEISVLLPAYNEALQIEKCLREVNHALSSLSDSYEIIVAEDGSTDGTNCVVADLSKAIPRLTLLHSPVRLGKGKAITNALNSAKGDVIIFMDVDLSTSLDCLPQVLKLVKEHGGMVIASRYVEGSKVRRPASRTLFSLAYNLLVRALFLDGIHDHQCGFKAMSHEVAEVLGDVKSNGFFFDTEMIIRCRESGFPVMEIGVEWSENRNRKSKVRLFRDAAEITLDMLRFRFGNDGMHPS